MERRNMSERFSQGRLIDYLHLLFYVPFKNMYGDVNITGEGLKNLGLCSALRTFGQGGIFIVRHLM
jgi:hypothetical protein